VVIVAKCHVGTSLGKALLEGYANNAAPTKFEISFEVNQKEGNK
jgi:hypothetical protein